MEKRLREGEWDEVIKGARPVYELLRDQDFYSFLKEALGYPNDALEAFISSVSSAFEFASKSLHEVARPGQGGGLRQQFHAAKEDAYLIYAVGVGVVNLVARKMQKSYS